MHPIRTIREHSWFFCLYLTSRAGHYCCFYITKQFEFSVKQGQLLNTLFYLNYDSSSGAANPWYLFQGMSHSDDTDLGVGHWGTENIKILKVAQNAFRFYLLNLNLYLKCLHVRSQTCCDVCRYLQEKGDVTVCL